MLCKGGGTKKMTSKQLLSSLERKKRRERKQRGPHSSKIPNEETVEINLAKARSIKSEEMYQ